MILSMKWLSDFVDTDGIEIKRYCDRMTDTGSKVEGYEYPDGTVSGVTVGEMSIVAAGATVAKNVAPYTLVGGCPAKLIRPLTHVEDNSEFIKKR